MLYRDPFPFTHRLSTLVDPFLVDSVAAEFLHVSNFEAPVAEYYLFKCDIVSRTRSIA